MSNEARERDRYHTIPGAVRYLEGLGFQASVSAIRQALADDLPHLTLTRGRTARRFVAESDLHDWLDGRARIGGERQG